MTRPTSPHVAERSSQKAYPFLLPPVEPDEIGRLGNYRVLALLGRGGMGLVFRAEDLTLRRPVALKVMKPDLEAGMRGWQRFLREARLMAAIKHEALVTVFQAGQEGDTVFLAMELLEGSTLEDWAARNSRPPVKEILRLAREIAAALVVIHCHGLVHRDIKPANLWLEAPHDRIKILDFGLARFVDDQSLTQTGSILGTPSFMSPEQARGDPVDSRSDLFSFGAILYYLCTGVEPFQAENTSGVLTALALTDPKPVRQQNPNIPLALSELIGQLLEKNPDHRPQSAEAVLERLCDIHLSESSADRPTLETKKSRPAGADKTSPISSKRRKSKNKELDSAGRGKRVALVALIAIVVAVTASAIGLLIFNQPVSKSSQGKSELVHLSKMEPFEVVKWPFIPPAPPGKPPHKGVGSVRVQGRPSPNGIFMHPPPGPGQAASITYNLDKQYDKFHTEVSFNDGPPGSLSPCFFWVYGDGKLLWKSLPVSSQQQAQTCSVDIAGVNKLTIAVTCSGEPKGAHAVWVEPHVTK